MRIHNMKRRGVYVLKGGVHLMVPLISHASSSYVSRKIPHHILTTMADLGSTAFKNMLSNPIVQEKHPELSTTFGEGLRERKRVVPMKVLNLGMPRTGTACMYQVS